MSDGKATTELIDWQPIETAPRDGTEIVVRDLDGESTAFWSDNPTCMAASPYNSRPAGWATGRYSGTDWNLPVCQPLEWRTLTQADIQADWTTNTAQADEPAFIADLAAEDGDSLVRQLDPGPYEWGCLDLATPWPAAHAVTDDEDANASMLDLLISMQEHIAAGIALETKLVGMLNGLLAGGQTR